MFFKDLMSKFTFLLYVTLPELFMLFLPLDVVALSITNSYVELSNSAEQKRNANLISENFFKLCNIAATSLNFGKESLYDNL